MEGMGIEVMWNNRMGFGEMERGVLGDLRGLLGSSWG
jgi:hypothetical protein